MSSFVRSWLIIPAQYKYIISFVRPLTLIVTLAYGGTPTPLICYVQIASVLFYTNLQNLCKLGIVRYHAKQNWSVILKIKICVL